MKPVKVWYGIGYESFKKKWRSKARAARHRNPGISIANFTLFTFMMPVLKYPLFILFSLLSAGRPDGTKPEARSALKEPDFIPVHDSGTFMAGEELTYKIYYNWNFIWLAAGEVVFKVEDLGDKYKLSARGRTYSSYEWFFKADDYFESIVRKSDLLPVSFIRDIKEGKYRYFEKIEFDQQGLQLKTWTGKSPETASESTHRVNKNMHDVLSLVYSMRTHSFADTQEGSVLPLNIFLDKKAYDLKLVYYGTKENKKVHRLGRYTSHHLSPEVIAGSVFKENDRMHIWASADKNQVPLLIESPVSVGSVKAVLSKYKGLKYEFYQPLP